MWRYPNKKSNIKISYQKTTKKLKKSIQNLMNKNIIYNMINNSNIKQNKF